MEVMKNGLKEANKALLKANMQLLGDIAQATGAPMKQYFKKCCVPLLFNLSDKQSLVRDAVLEAMKKWEKAIGATPIVQQLVIQCETENPELRKYSLTWVIEHKDGIQGAEVELMVKPLCVCLCDKDSKIRVQAEEIIVVVMQQTGFEPFQR